MWCVHVKRGHQIQGNHTFLVDFDVTFSAKFRALQEMIEVSFKKGSALFLCKKKQLGSGEMFS